MHSCCSRCLFFTLAAPSTIKCSGRTASWRGWALDQAGRPDLSPFCVRRYIAVETAISATINTRASVSPAALSFTGREASPIARAHGLAFATAPQLFTSTLMSALILALLTHRRQMEGTIRTTAGSDRISLARIGCTSLLFAAPLAVLGVFTLDTLVLQMAGVHRNPLSMLILDDAYSGCLVALVTTSALLLLFGRGWQADQLTDTRVVASTDGLFDGLQQAGSRVSARCAFECIEVLARRRWCRPRGCRPGRGRRRQPRSGRAA